MKLIKYQITAKKYKKISVDDETYENTIKILNKIFYKQQSKDYFYRKKVVSLEMLNEKGYDISDNSLLNQIYKNKKYELLYSSIDKLSKKQKQIIKYIFFQGYSLKESAQILKINYQSAFELKKRALTRLNMLLKENYK